MMSIPHRVLCQTRTNAPYTFKDKVYLLVRHCIVDNFVKKVIENTNGQGRLKNLFYWWPIQMVPTVKCLWQKN